jgi:hypothetical protein
MATFHNFAPPQAQERDLYVYNDGTVSPVKLGSGRAHKAGLAVTLKAGQSVRITPELASALHNAGLEVDDTDTRSQEFERALADPDHSRVVAETSNYRVLNADEADAEDVGRRGLRTIIGTDGSEDENVVTRVEPDPSAPEALAPEQAHPADPAKVNPDPANPGASTEMPPPAP